MGTTSKRCRSYWVSVRRKSGRFCAVNCPPDGQQSYISCCWLPVCRSVSAAGGARTARQPAKTIRGDAWQPMWAREDVCELFAQNRRYAEVEPRIKTGIDSRLGGETLCLSHCGYTSWRCCILPTSQPARPLLTRVTASPTIA